MKLAEIADLLGGQLIGGGDLQITGVSPFEEAKAGEITLAFKPKFRRQIALSLAAAFIVTEALPEEVAQIVVKHEKGALFLLASLFSKPPSRPAVSDWVSADTSAKIDESVLLGPFTTVGAGTVIKKNTTLHSHVVIGENCEIGEGCTFYPGVVICDGSVIGDRVVLYEGAKIGTVGFGYIERKGEWTFIPHIGSVEIGHDVQIGANTCVDRGCLGKTRIGNGVIVDNLVQIAHNVQIGDHTAIAGMTVFGGSTRVGAHAKIGGGSKIRDGIEIGDYAIVMGNSGVTKSVGKGEMISGDPAMPHKERLKQMATLARLSKREK